jgi:nucleosome assembly protein 1-like 1
MTEEGKTSESVIPKMSTEEVELEMKMIKVISKMPANIQTRFKVLHMLSDERSRINDEFEKELKALEAKMQVRRAPILEKRAKILKGEDTNFGEYLPLFDEQAIEVKAIVAGIVKTPEDIEAEKDEKEHVATNVDHLKTVAGVPDFWKVAAENNMLLQQAIRKQDKEAIGYLADVFAKKTEDPQSVTVEFTFNENPFFSNTKLHYTVRVKDNGEEPEGVDGCVIDWKEGKNLTVKKIKKKQKHKKTNETRTIVKTVPTDSFFNIFESKKAPEDIEPKDGEDMDSDVEKMLMGLEEALDVANDFYDMYSSDALEYYLNFGQQYGDFMGAGAYGDEDDAGEEEEEEKPKKAPKGGKKDAEPSAGAPGEPKPECKQQ